MGGSPLHDLRASDAPASIVTPDANYGSNWNFINKANISDGNSATSSDSGAGGGVSSPSYAPSIRVAIPQSGTVVGQGSVIGFKIEYQWTHSLPGFATGAEVQVFFQWPGAGTPEWYKHVVRQASVEGEKDPKGIETFYFPQGK